VTPSTHTPMPIGTSTGRLLTATRGIRSVLVAIRVGISSVIIIKLIAGGLTINGLACSSMTR